MLFPQSNGIRQRHELGGFWDFMVDPEDCGEDKKWFEGFEGVKVAVPASFNEQLHYSAFDGIDLLNYQGAVWYGRKFFVPTGMVSGRIVLRFGAVYKNARVWLNGRFLGEDSGGYLPFEFDITETVRSDEEDLLVVRVNNEIGLSDIPQGRPVDDKSQSWPTYVDWFPYGGIYRPVVLYSTAADYIEDMTIKTDIDGVDGVIRYAIKTRGESANSITVSVHRGPHNIQQKHDQCPQSVVGEIRVEGAAFWSPEAPDLYEFQVDLAGGDKIVDRYSLKIGIRTIRVEGNRFLLNNKPVFLRGVCKHEDFPILGRGMDRAVINKDLSLIKWLGANAVRCTHYPFAEEFLELADELGIVVFGEVPAWVLIGDFLSDELLATHKRIIAGLLARDKNHPSVVGWYLANEPYFGDGTSIDTVPSQKEQDYFKEICQFAKSLDDRPVTIAGCTNRDEYILQFCDIVSVNRYYGWYHYPGRLAYAAEKLSENLDELYQKVRKPIIISEFGADGMVGVHADPPAMFSEDYQAEFYQKVIPLLESKPYIVGEMIWVFSDFLTYQSPHRVVYNRKGIFTRDRLPKMAARTVKTLWEKGKDD